jgi:glycosyltransferase involved in cell wall biosynthesis
MGDVDNVRVIYNALDLPPGGLREMRPGDPFVVVSASRFIPHKRIPVIVRAFAALQDPHARLVLIGSGTNEQVGIAKAAVAEAGVGRQVTFLGKLDSLREADKLYGAFKQASVYVSASLEEGFPNVFVEAMHFGLPIVSTDVGGCREIVTDGRTGFLVDPADETGFARRLKELKENTERRNEMAEAAVEQSKRFELAAVLGQFKSLYAEAIRRTLSTQ